MDLAAVPTEDLLDEVALRLARKVKAEDEHLKQTVMLWRTMRIRQLLHATLVQRTLDRMAEV